MKKLFTLLVLALSFSAIFAQQTTVALLNHEGTITTYYGTEALSQAYKAAVDGDVITLSEGSFTAPSSWTKALTLRGAGCFAGEDNSRGVTHITNTFYHKVPKENESLSIYEGIDFKAVNYNDVYCANTTFIKCSFTWLSDICRNTSFYNCIINESISTVASATYPGAIKIYNSYIHNLISESTYGSVKLTNCIIRNKHSQNLRNCSFSNCIFIGQNSDYTVTYYDLDASCTANNCLSCFCYYKAESSSSEAIYDYNIFDNITGTTNSYFEAGTLFDENIKTIFTTYDGKSSFSFHELYELTDEAKTTYIGSDGTQIGIYGGMGFDLVPSTLQITKCEVSPKATKEGKISVSIEVGIPE